MSPDRVLLRPFFAFILLVSLCLALAAVAHGFVGPRWGTIVPDGYEVELFALLGMPVYVCASGATPLVAVLIHNGVSPGAALAFLLTGPATNLTTIGVLTRLHGRRTALLFCGCVIVVALLLGRAVNAFTNIGGSVPDLATTHEMGVGWQEAALAVLTGLFLLSLIRQGPRAFVGELFEADGDDADDDGHHHSHDHDHGHAGEAEGCCHDCASDPEPEPVADVPVRSG